MTPNVPSSDTTVAMAKIVRVMRLLAMEVRTRIHGETCQMRSVSAQLITIANAKTRRVGIVHAGTVRVDPSATTTPEAAATALPVAQVIKKADYDKLDVYFNLDNGTGKIRGVYLQNNETVRPLFRQWLMPFRDMGAATLSIANTGGTDHLSFDAIGLPGFQFIQDEIEYDSRTHHSNQDVFDRVQGEDMKQAATIMAAFIYNAAMRDEKVPRKPPR